MGGEGPKRATKGIRKSIDKPVAEKEGSPRRTGGRETSWAQKKLCNEVKRSSASGRGNITETWVRKPGILSRFGFRRGASVYNSCPIDGDGERTGRVIEGTANY